MIARKDQTPEQIAMFAERRRERDHMKNKRRKAAKSAAKIAIAPIKIENKTDPVTRRRLYGFAPEMTKNELRAVLAQAARNTADMST